MTTNSGSPVGFVGLGVMGSALATRLANSGQETVVWNRTAGRAAPAATSGAAVAATPADVVIRCGVVLSCLLDADAVRAVYTGPAGLLTAAQPGTLIVEHGTIDPSVIRDIAEDAGRAGVAIIDAPVSGGPAGAAAGTLMCMVGGDAGDVVRVRPHLEAYCRDIVHVGALGSALELKLVNQLLVTGNAAVAAEAGALARCLGLRAETVVRVLTGGWGNSTMLELSLADVLAGEHPRTGARIGGLHQLQPLIKALAERHGLAASVHQAAAARLAAAVQHGYADEDLSALALPALGPSA